MESSLADTYRDIVGGVAFDLGFVRSLNFDLDAFATTNPHKFANLTMAVKGGLQQFYKPPVDQSGMSYSWSFLKPLRQVTLEEGEKTVRMHDDFAGVEGLVHVMLDNGGYSLKIGNRVRGKYAAYPDTTGQPTMIEQEGIANTTKERGQRFQFVVWPLADADYTLEFHQTIQGEMLTGDLPYAYGGAEHSSTIRASCLAWAELHFDDLQNGPKQQYFRERLAVSISIDRGKQPQTLGYNGDRSDLMRSGWGDRRDRCTQWPPLLYNGSTFGSE